MFAFALDGHTARIAPVRAVLHRRLPAVVLIGLPAHLARECATRVRDAVVACGWEWPRQRIELEVQTTGGASTHTELALAVAVLVASEQLPASAVEGLAFHGELSLSGEVRSVRGTVAAALAAQEAGKLLVVARGAGADAAARLGLPVASIGSLADLRAGRPALHVPPAAVRMPSGLDMVDLRAQDPSIPDQLVEAARTRAPLFLVGPPGCGKMMLAARLGGILPTLSLDEEREVALRHDAAGLTPLAPARPFRAPHHTISRAGFLGHRPVTATGAARPGEIDLAQEGVLLLDEVAEFSEATLEALRHALAEPGRRVWLVLTGEAVSEADPRWAREQKALTRLGLDSSMVTRIVLRTVPHEERTEDRAWPTSEALRARVEAA